MQKTFYLLDFCSFILPWILCVLLLQRHSSVDPRCVLGGNYVCAPYASVIIAGTCPPYFLEHACLFLF